MIDAVLRTAALVLVTGGLTYLLVSLGLGLNVQRRVRRGTHPSFPPADDLHLFVMIPCLNEEAVIAATVKSMLDQEGAERLTIIVIDDASDDATAAIVRAFDRPNVQLCRRVLPDARLGKGAALNHALGMIREQAAARGLAPESTIVCVMDADGRLSEGTIARVGEAFGDPMVGGMQLAVRIRNRIGRNVLPKMQDLEFWALSATTQAGRMGTQTVSLGGNGQMSRLSALDSVGVEPWSDSLTEDLDLAVSLAVRGWRLTFLPGAYVDQQGVTDMKLLIRQRTRWFQGHMSTARRIPEIWRSPHLDNSAALELTTYLLVPWVFVLPWSLLGHYALYHSIRAVLHPVGPDALGGPVGGQIMLTFFWYVTGFLPNIVLGWIYFRRDRGVGRLRAMALSHLMIPYNYLGYAAAWKALWRIITGKKGWAKTTRVVEGPVLVPLPTMFPAVATSALAPVVTPTFWTAVPPPYVPPPKVPQREWLSDESVGGLIAAALWSEAS